MQNTKIQFKYPYSYTTYMFKKIKYFLLSHNAMNMSANLNYGCWGKATDNNIVFWENI